jgi:predicted RNA binding protein YcfA (HicA-like mRNA interferase family)
MITKNGTFVQYFKTFFHMKRVFKVSEVLKALRDDGWYQVSQSGSHRQFEHPEKPGQTTVAGEPSIELLPKTLRSILKQAGLTRSDLSGKKKRRPKE